MAWGILEIGVNEEEREVIDCLCDVGTPQSLVDRGTMHSCVTLAESWIEGKHKDVCVHPSGIRFGKNVQMKTVLISNAGVVVLNVTMIAWQAG